MEVNRRSFWVTLVLLASAGGCTSSAPSEQNPPGPTTQAELAGAAGLEHGLPEFVKIEGGTFTMGNLGIFPDDPVYFPDETPVRVTVGDFDIARTVITAEQFCEFLNSPEVADEVRALYYRLDREGPGDYPWSSITFEQGRYVPRANAEKAPANFVTWIGAMRYCQWLTRRTGTAYRLPTEAEWEYAARGKEGRQWPWGDEPPVIEQPRKSWHLFGPVTGPDPSRGDRWVPEPWTGEPWPKYSVDDFPAGATPEGVLGFLGDTASEWCLNVFYTNPTPAQANDKSFDYDTLDLSVPRVLRGVYHRLGVVEAKWHWRTYWQDGRVWSRVRQSPLGGDMDPRGDDSAFATVRLVRD